MLANRLDCGFFAFDVYILGRREETFRDPRNWWRHRSREKCSKTCLRHGFHDGLYIVNKAHSKHFVGFVKNQCVDVFEAQRARLR